MYPSSINRGYRSGICADGNRQSYESIHPLSIEAIVLAVAAWLLAYCYDLCIHPLSIEAIVLALPPADTRHVIDGIHPLSIEAIVLAAMIARGERHLSEVSILYQSRLSFWLTWRCASWTLPSIHPLSIEAIVLAQQRQATAHRWHCIHPLSIEAIVLAERAFVTAGRYEVYPSSINRGYRSGFGRDLERASF